MASDTASKRINRRAEEIGFRWWQLPIAIAAVVSIVFSVFVSIAIGPYQPFVVRSYIVSPEEVCAGQPVRAVVTRRFTADVDYLELTERYITLDGRPVPNAGGSGTLPGSQLGRTEHPVSAVSPLLETAPKQPGTYRVRITAQFKGDRKTLPFHAEGTASFMSDNYIKVREC